MEREGYEPEEHLGVLAHPDEWRPGAVCQECRDAYRARMALLKHPVPAASLRRLRHERETGISSRDVEKGVVEAAKRDGRDLARPADFASQHWKAH